MPLKIILDRSTRQRTVVLIPKPSQIGSKPPQVRHWTAEEYRWQALLLRAAQKERRTAQKPAATDTATPQEETQQENAS